MFCQLVYITTLKDSVSTLFHNYANSTYLKNNILHDVITNQVLIIQTHTESLYFKNVTRFNTMRVVYKLYENHMS